MANIKVRDLSELIKVERVETSENNFAEINRNPGDIFKVKVEKSDESDGETEIGIKIEPTDDDVVDVNDDKTHSIYDDEEEKFGSVLQLIKRTIKLQQCLCEECGAICDSKTELNSHRRQYHCIRSKFKRQPPSLIGCLRCSKRFSTYRLRYHHMFIHRNLSPLMCRYCNRCFNTVKAADYHLQCSHIRFGTTPLFVCCHCYMCFYQVKAYERHFHRHNNRFKCTICFRRFRHLNHFHDHLIETHSACMKHHPKELDSMSVKSVGTVKSELSMGEDRKDSTAAGSRMECFKQFNCSQCRWLYFSTKHTLDSHTETCHTDVNRLDGGGEESNQNGMNKENLENATKHSGELTEKEVCNIAGKKVVNSQSSDLVVDEIGEVDMSSFEELIKRFLS